jgi:hypothetical protein
VIGDKYWAGNFVARDELLIHILSWDIAVRMTGMLQHYTVRMTGMLQHYTVCMTGMLQHYTVRMTGMLQHHTV